MEKLKLTRAEAMKKVWHDDNYLNKCMGYQPVSIEDLEFISEHSKEFTNRAFHIDNGQYSIRSGVENTYIISIEKSNLQYILTQIIFTDRTVKYSLDIE